MDRLISDLRRADLVVGFNVLRFDYTVLAAYSVFDLSTVPTLDLMVSLEEKIKHRVGLDAVAEATCGVKKTASGMEAIQWWREGKQKQVAEYCCYDVKTTRLVHEHGGANGKGQLRQSQNVPQAICRRRLGKNRPRRTYPPARLRGFEDFAGGLVARTKKNEKKLLDERQEKAPQPSPRRKKLNPVHQPRGAVGRGPKLVQMPT